MLEKISSFLADELPVLNRHFYSQGFEPSSLFAQFCISLFAYKLPLSIAIRVFELFLLEGETAITGILYSMLRSNEAKMMKMTE